MASPNTLTNLIPFMYAGMDRVSRALVGFIPAVSRDSTVDAVKIGQTVNVPIVGAITPVSITPGSYAPDTGGVTPGNTTITISNQYAAPIAYNGDEQLAISETGIYNSVISQRFEQAFRGITSLVEADLAALHIKASRAQGTDGTQPMATAGNFTDLTNAMKILKDNGAPQGDLQCVLSSTATANMMGLQSTLFKVNEAGTSDLLRQGRIGSIFGVDMHESGSVKQDVTAGTAASATSTNAAFTVGQTVIPLATAGTGLVIAGDIVTFANDTNKYVVTSVVFAGANPASGDTITLAEPGLRVAQGAATRAITLIAATDRNMLFSKSAIILATRTPYMPFGGDGAADVYDFTDPVSGLTFQIAEYKGYRQTHFEVGLAWGVKVIAPRHTALMIG